MDFDVWIRNLIHDCTQPKNSKLNLLHTASLIAASADKDPDFQVKDLEELRASVEMNWRYGGEQIRGDSEAPPDIFHLENCGALANWLTKLLMSRFHVEFAKRKQDKLGKNTQEYNEILWMLDSRSSKHHHLLRIDSSPLGHSYVLYLPPGKNEADYHYYLYQANQAVAFPMFGLQDWLKTGRSRIQGDPREHIKNLRRLDGFIFTQCRDWVIDTFTPLDRSTLKVSAGGWYVDPADQVRRQLPNGEMPLSQRGHKFTLAPIEESVFREKLRTMYADTQTQFVADRFPQVHLTSAPTRRGPSFSLGAGDDDSLAEAHHVLEAQLLEQRVELLVREAPVGQNRHLHLGRNQLAQPQQDAVLHVIAHSLERGLVDRQPHQGRGAPVSCAQRGHQRGVVVLVEVRPVQGHHGLGALSHDVRHPEGKQVPHLHARVGQQPVHLLHPVLALLAPRHCQGLPDGVHREARGVDDAQEPNHLTTRPGVALAPGLTAHIPWASPVSAGPLASSGFGSAPT